jgi:hypothetical protein
MLATRAVSLAAPSAHNGGRNLAVIAIDASVDPEIRC